MTRILPVGDVPEAGGYSCGSRLAGDRAGTGNKEYDPFSIRFITLWVELRENALILETPPLNAVPVSWKSTTFLTIVSG